MTPGGSTEKCKILQSEVEQVLNQNAHAKSAKGAARP